MLQEEILRNLKRGELPCCLLSPSASLSSNQRGGRDVSPVFWQCSLSRARQRASRMSFPAAACAQIHVKCDLASVSKLVLKLHIPFFAACAFCNPLYTICLKDFFPAATCAPITILQSIMHLKKGRHAIRFKKMAKFLEPVKLWLLSSVHSWE